MATTAHRGSTTWRRNWSKSGLRVLFMSDYAVGHSFIGGAFWNGQTTLSNDTTPDRFPLKNISGRPTSLGFRTIESSLVQIGVIASPADLYGYPDAAYDRSQADNSTDMSFEIYGIPRDHIVDLVLGGGTDSTTDRGGIYEVSSGGIVIGSSEVNNDVGSAGFTGPIMFAGIEPIDGIIRFTISTVTVAMYWSFFDLVAYRR